MQAIRDIPAPTDVAGVKRLSIFYLLKVLTYLLLIHWTEPTETTVEMTREIGLKSWMSVYMFGDILDKRLDEIREATSCDASLQSVMKLVLGGWPTNKHETFVSALPYFDVRDCLKVLWMEFWWKEKQCDSHGFETVNQDDVALRGDS